MCNVLTKRVYGLGWTSHHTALMTTSGKISLRLICNACFLDHSQSNAYQICPGCTLMDCISPFISFCSEENNYNVPYSMN